MTPYTFTIHANEARKFKSVDRATRVALAVLSDYDVATIAYDIERHEGGYFIYFSSEDWSTLRVDEYALGYLK